MINQEELQLQDGIYLEMVDFDAVFNALSHTPVIVNDYDPQDKESLEELKTLLFTKYDGDTLTNVPQCDGGHLKGGFRVGTFCPICKTKVTPITEKPLESLLWMETPKGIDAFINPTWWDVVSNHTTISGYNILEWLTNPRYESELRATNGTVRRPKAVDKLESWFTPGINNFVREYDKVIQFMLENRCFTGTMARRNKLRDFLSITRNSVFCKRLPFPSKLIFIVEEKNNCTFVDTKQSAPAFDAILMITSLDNRTKPTSQDIKESRVVKVIQSLNTFYADFEKNIAFKKEGVFRKLILGTRPEWTFRCVIISKHGIHDYETLTTPWSMTIQLLKTHISNILLKRRFTPNEIVAIINEGILRYSPLLAEIVENLIQLSKNAGYKGIPCTWGRNPTLDRLSIQFLYIDDFFRNPSVNTVAMSDLILKGPNADFDGDAMNGGLTLCHKWTRWFQRLEPHLGIMDLNKPFEVSGKVALPTPILSTIDSWLSEGDELTGVGDIWHE